MIEGDGEFVKTGAGTLRLTGENTYEGLTTIESGILYLGDGGVGGSVAGDIHNDNGVLGFYRSDDFVYDGSLSGTGESSYSTRFVGTGITTLTGDSSTLGGSAVVLSGNLRLADTALFGTAGLWVMGNGGFGDPVIGTLSGTGTVLGNVILQGGILAPGGDTLGTLNVAGDVMFAGGVVVPAATMAVRIASDGTHDALAPTSVDIISGEVAVTAIDAHTSYVDGQDYTIITTSDPNGVTGTFGDVTMASHSAFLTPTLTHNADNVVLTIAVTQDFAMVAETFNQLQAASGLNDLDKTPGSDALLAFNTIANMNEDDARRAFDLSSGEIHASGQHVIDQTFALFNRTLRYQGVAGIGAGNVGAETFTAPLGYGPAVSRGNEGVVAIDGATDYADARVRGAWAAPLGGFGRIDSDGNAGELKWWNGGLAGGYEGVIDLGAGNAVGGLGFGYIRSHGSVDARLSSFDSDGFYLGAYGAWADGPWTVAGSLSYGANRVSTERNIAFMGTTAEASYWMHSIGLSGEASYAFDLADTTRIAPLFTLDAGWSGHGGFNETGAGALNLSSGSESWTRFDAGIGLAVTHAIMTESGRITVEGRAVWEHAFADVVPSQALTLAGSPTGFTVHGPAADRNRLRLGAGLSWDVSEDMTVRARYDGLFSGDQNNHTASFGLNIRF